MRRIRVFYRVWFLFEIRSWNCKPTRKIFWIRIKFVGCLRYLFRNEKSKLECFMLIFRTKKSVLISNFFQVEEDIEKFFQGFESKREE